LPGATALLASARAVRLQGLRLDAPSAHCAQSAAPLIIEVRRLHAEGGGALYEFSVDAGAALARGRLSLLLA